MSKYAHYTEEDIQAIFPAMSAFGGLVLIDIDYGIEDYAITAFQDATVETKSLSKFRRTKIYATGYSQRPYIIRLGTRWYLDECFNINRKVR